MNSTPVWRLYVLAVIVLTFSGCGQRTTDLPPLHPVHGTVTLDEKPLSGATLFFLPEKGPSSSGVTTADGSYEVQYSAGQKGAVSGTTKVMITTAAPDNQGGLTPERLPKKYNEQTRLEFVVKEGDNEQNFDLKSK